MVGQLADKVTLELEAKTAAYRANVNATKNEFNRNVEAMARSAEKMEQSVSASGRKMSYNLSRAIAAIGVASAVKSAQELADTWTAAGNKLAAAGVEIERVAGTQNLLADTARATRSEYDSTANTFARIKRATDDLNASQSQQLRVTELINKATKAGGATTQEQISTITQLTQALASGNLQGDELRSIRENSPLIARAIAKEFGVTIGQLKQLGKEGKLTSDRVFKAILDYGPAIDSQFAKTKSTIGESFTALETEAGRFLSQFDKANGVTNGITAFVDKVANDFDLLAQAVVVSAAVVGGALTGRFAQSMLQTANVQKGFVADILAGKVAMDLEAAAAQKNARDILLKAQADRDATRQQVVATQARITALREEAAAYQTNIALATAQQRTAARQVATGRNAAGVFVSRDAAQVDQNTATKAVVANRLQLARVTKELAAAESTLSAQHVELGNRLAAVSTASVNMRSALQGTSIAAQAASIAAKGLGAALNFFGGPVGVAIIAVGAAMAYLSTEAAKAEAAGANAESVLSDMQSQAESTSPEIANLANKQTDQASAANLAARESRSTAGAYDTLGNAARNAAENVKYLTAQQRQNQLEKIREARRDLQKAETGSNPFLTNGQERLANAQTKLIRLGTGGNTIAGFPGSEDLLAKALKNAAAPGATKELQDAAQEYRNQVRLRSEAAKQLSELKAAEDVIFKSIDDPTLPKPPTPTSNLVAPPGSGSGSGSGSTKGRKGKSPEDILAARELLDLQNRINIAQAQGSEDLAQFLQDRVEYLETVKKLEADGKGLSREQAEAQAAAYINELQLARQIGKENKDRQEAEKKALDDKADQEKVLKDLRERQAYLADEDLRLQIDLAELAGNSERVKELERILALRQRIRQYESQGGLSPEAAAARGTADQNQLNAAQDLAELKDPIKDLFKNGVRAALDGDLSDYLSNWFKDGAARGLENALNNLTDALFELFKGVKIGGSGDGAFGKVVSDTFKSFFGGKRAGGGQMQAGRWYMTGENGPEPIYVGNTAKAFPNSTLRAAASGSSGAAPINLQVVNNTGVPVTAKTERQSNGDVKISLEPLMNNAIAGQGRSGNLYKALKSSPKPVKRA